MPEFKAKLIDKIQRTPNIKSFRFEPENKVDFLPGQFVFVIFDTADLKNKNLNKYLSFSSSPLKNYFEVTKRLSQSEFSRRLDSLKIGDEVNFKGPIGNCVFKEEFKKIAFLIGGIGITPVISIIEYVVEKKLDTDVILLYSNRIIQEMAFKKDLDKWKQEDKNIKITYTITDCQVSDDECVQGRINKGLILQRIEDIENRVFFIFGPPGMVGAMKQLCVESGCNESSILAENFVGY